MTLAELGKCYEDSAVLLRKRLHELRSMLSATQDPEEIWNIKRRIADLTPMLTQMNELSWMLQHYYERCEAVRDDRYGFNGIRKPPKKWEANADIDADIAKRVKRFAKADICGISLRKEEHGSNCKRTRSKQKYSEPDAKTCGADCLQPHEILPDVSRFFSLDPKKYRRTK